jgi:predicted AAA+ superfamily ATPase
VWDGSYSRALENMVYLHLRRNHPRVDYYLTRDRRQEVDFLVSDGRGRAIMAVQVCQDIGHPDTLRRELEPLSAAARYFGVKEALIVTLSEERRIEDDGLTIHALPAWKWLASE